VVGVEEAVTVQGRVGRALGGCEEGGVKGGGGG
jgi:hypothetical protein